MMRITVAFATETGNAQDLAEAAVVRLRSKGIELGKAINMEDVTLEALRETDVFLAVVSTWGDGEPPTDAEDFYAELSGAEVLELTQLRYSVLALGDSCYDLFCQFGKDLDAQLARHGASCVYERVECDIDVDEGYEAWVEGVASQLLSEAD